MLKIDIPEKKEGQAELQELDVKKSKDIISESLSAMTGTNVKPEFLGSYLTVEGGEDDDLDLSYTQSEIGDILSAGINALILNKNRRRRRRKKG